MIVINKLLTIWRNLADRIVAAIVASGVTATSNHRTRLVNRATAISNLTDPWGSSGGESGGQVRHTHTHPSGPVDHTVHLWKAVNECTGIVSGGSGGVPGGLCGVPGGGWWEGGT